MSKTKVLFLCTGNSARSQMGEALLRKHADDLFEVHSAGLEPKGINPYTVRVLEEIGIDTSTHTSDTLRKYMGHMHFGYLVTVCSAAEERCPAIFPGVAHRLHWPFEDPAAFEGSDEATMAKFREVRDQIDVRVQEWLAELKAEPAL
ncbi:arsenate reductase ArsC [bacterium]|nr:arsenate reductase ArsC [bacterium]